jgi:chorismate-pyruvate lyase
MMVTPTRKATPELQALTSLFYASLDELGKFSEVDASEMPETARKLLWHDEHMTETVEAFHGTPVDVSVLETNKTPTHYARRILLNRKTDGQVVQFGIVRLSVESLGNEVRQEIERQESPLGTILIRHNVLRQVRPMSLWKIVPGTDLRKLFGLDEIEVCFGRTALIYCDGLPAVELLEIVTPV